MEKIRDLGNYYEECAPKVNGILRKYVSSPEDREDIVQEAFLKAHRNFEKFDPSSKFINWITRIAINTAFDKSHRLTEPLQDDALLYDPSPTPEQVLERKEDLLELEGILNTLPPRAQEVLYYRYILEQSVKETALRMGISEGSVKGGAFRAREKFKEEYGRT